MSLDFITESGSTTSAIKALCIALASLPVNIFLVSNILSGLTLGNISRIASSNKDSTTCFPLSSWNTGLPNSSVIVSVVSTILNLKLSKSILLLIAHFLRPSASLFLVAWDIRLVAFNRLPIGSCLVSLGVLSALFSIAFISLVPESISSVFPFLSFLKASPFLKRNWLLIKPIRLLLISGLNLIKRGVKLSLTSCTNSATDLPCTVSPTIPFTIKPSIKFPLTIAL